MRRAGLAALAGVTLALAFAPLRIVDADVARRAAPGTAPEMPLVAILGYHDLSHAPQRLDTVTPAFLRAQIRSCKAAGWTFLSLSELLAHRGDPSRLPPRTLVLTFDDGYRSFADLALPILREEGVKATLAIVTSFIDRPPPGLPPLMTWQQIRELEASGQVEIVSHSHDLHRYEVDNPWRDTSPAAAARRYLIDDVRYETRDEYRSRIRGDMHESRRILAEHLGHPVDVLAWPYGEHNRMARELARAAGYAVTLSLGARAVTAADLAEGCLPRVMVDRRLDFAPAEPRWLNATSGAVRAAQVDVDALWDPDTSVFRTRVEEMVRRVRRAGATHVFLQACHDPEGNGMLRGAWFMNHQTPVRADVWSMIAHKLAHAGIKVWVRAPSMNLSWEWERHPDWRIPRDPVEDEPAPWYHRLSPNLPAARAAAVDFYTDLAVYLPIQGVLFDDDAYLLEGERLNGAEDSSPAAKLEAIRGLHDEIRAAVRAWRPECRFARNLYAPVVEREGIHPRFAQDYEQSLREYDLTVVMAYARMEGHQRDAASWTRSLTRRALKRWKAPQGRSSEGAPVMMKLQAYDWAAERWVPGSELQVLAAAAHKAGAVHLGVYPFPVDPAEVPDRLLEGLDPAPQVGARP